MSTIFDGLTGVLCLMDDILIFAEDQKEHQKEHNTRLTAALERIQAAGVTLNKDKCEFNKTSNKLGTGDQLKRKPLLR